MNVIVCVKQVPDTNIALEVDPQTGAINSDDLVYIVNPCDWLAVEEAAHLKEEGKASQITLISLGQPSATRALRSCLALGADKAVLLNDPAFNDSDSYATGVVLSQAIGSLPYDLILCGARASDTNTGLTGAVIAETLGLPLVSEVTRINSVADKKLQVQRKLEKGNREVVEVSLPAVLTIEGEAEKTRYASLPALIEAQTKQIEQLDLKALGLSPMEAGQKGSKTQTLGYSLPKPRKKKLFAPDTSLSATAKIAMLMKGGIQEKKTDFLEGDPKKIAQTLVKMLTQQKLIKLQ
jgi:electron transfer flavoprotein beta subunit